MEWPDLQVQETQAVSVKPHRVHVTCTLTTQDAQRR